MLTVLLGGARSGKSSLAVEVGRRHTGPVVYVATSPRIDGDADLDARIAAHRAERPAHWSTVEEQHDLDAVLADDEDSMLIVDCLTLWVSNLVWRGDSDDDVSAAASRAAATASARSAPTIVVSNEVGLGIHPAGADGRRYRDLLGRVNQHWVAAADRALLMVAGRALPLHAPADLLS